MAKEQVTTTTIDKLVPDDKNFNKGTEYGKQLLGKSFAQFGAGRSILLDKNNRIIAGNKATEEYGEQGGEKVIVVETDGTTLVAVKRTDIDLDSKRGRELALADNATQKADLDWDTEVVEAVSKEWEIDAKAWGVKAEEWETPDDEAAEIERKRKEFEERIAAGEISEEDEEYQEFLEKFKLKKTTDDCYTPPIVYEAVADWVAKEYGLSKANFVRPFYPGGDYQKEKYKPTDVVVDNPPFSILAKILNFYKEHGIRFFLFAPTLTLFSSSSSSSALPCGVAITYANGANVSTSFLTDLEPKTIRVRSCPTLYEAVKNANDINLAQMRKSLPKYSYDHHIITAPFIGALSRLGIDLSIPVAESEPISQLDCQKESGKAIYGKGYIVGERVFAEREKAEREKAEREKAEREKAEREKAEREKAERWELSDREKAIVAKLSR